MSLVQTDDARISALKGQGTGWGVAWSLKNCSVCFSFNILQIVWFFYHEKDGFRGMLDTWDTWAARGVTWIRIRQITVNGRCYIQQLQKKGKWVKELKSIASKRNMTV